MPATAADEKIDIPDLRDLYRRERLGLVRLAAILLHDEREAEDVVQDAFVGAYLAWGRLRESDKALSYLRSAVLNRARSRLRRQRTMQRFIPRPLASSPSSEAAALAHHDHDAMLAALRSLPDRQRECLVLRYYLDLGHAEIGTTLGISAGSVKTHLHRGLAALGSRMEAQR